MQANVRAKRTIKNVTRHMGGEGILLNLDVCLKSQQNDYLQNAQRCAKTRKDAQRRAKTRKDAQRRAKTRKDAQRRAKTRKRKRRENTRAQIAQKRTPQDSPQEFFTFQT